MIFALHIFSNILLFLIYLFYFLQATEKMKHEYGLNLNPSSVAQFVSDSQKGSSMNIYFLNLVFN